MSKIRIYELAKELGVDNRVVITKAQELGFTDKSSHSHSLDGDEADRIRRALLRQAVGSAPKKEVITRRVDKATGTAEAVVESRSGNVIRRRKAGPSEGAPTQDSGSSESSAYGGISLGGAALEQHVADAEPLHHDPVEQSTNGIHALAESEGVAPELSAENHLSSEGESVSAVSEAATVQPAQTASEPVTATAGAAADPVKKPGIGPRVLGKILLPQKKVVKTERSPAPGTFGVVAPVIEDEDEDDDAADKRRQARKRTKKVEFNRVDLVDYDGREPRRTSRGPRSRQKGDDDDARQNADAARPRASKRVVEMGEAIVLGDLARQMSLKAGEVIAKLMDLGIMATINHSIDMDTAAILAEEFGFTIQSTTFNETTILEDESKEEVENSVPRSPIVTVMGHVDHGKTSLLDRIRSASVAAKEAGGITQHIGAYRVVLPGDRAVTFIDTPGHAAFTAMRARGATVTDIVVLVVAADDGVMPQTIEAINHAKAAGVTIVVAVNKIDKVGGNYDRIKQQLVEHGLQPEDWGGDTMYFPVSALKGTGVTELLEGLLLVADVKELRGNQKRRAKGTIIEARQEKGRGTVATVLVQNGTLHVGEIFVCGAQVGRVRSMLDDSGRKIDEAGPSFPVEITGLEGVPAAGDDFFVVESEDKAQQVAASRAEKRAAKERALAAGPISLEEFARRSNSLAAAELNMIIKADVHGSLEAVADALGKLSTDKVKVRVIHSGVGGINESDVQLAIASRASIVGFGVRAEPRALQEAESIGVGVRFYRIIYELIEDVKKAMAGLLDPVKKEVRLGRAEVREVFQVPKMGAVAGSFVVDGLVRRNSQVRLLRDSRVIFEGKVGSLRRFKDDVREVQNGFECGIGIDGFNDVKVGDTMEIFEIQEVAATL